MKYFWGWFETHDGQITVVSNSDQAEVGVEIINTISEKSKTIGRFISYHMYFEMLFRNFMDILKVIDEFEQAEKNFKFEQEFIPYSYNINRLFINALGSIFTYINHYENSIADSDISKSMKRLTSEFYDKYPLYRFLYKLRNFVVHIGLPITCLSSTLDRPEKEFYIDRNYLLENYDRWGPKVTADIKSFDENISVKELTNDAMKLFLEFHLKLMEKQISQVLEIQRFFDGLGRHVEGQIQYPVLLRIDEEKNEVVGLENIFDSNMIQVEHALRILGIEAHSGKVISDEASI